MCDQPELSMKDALTTVRRRLVQERFLLQYVPASATAPELVCSVGLTAYGLPELVVLALEPPPAASLVTAAAFHLLDATVMLPGEAVAVGGLVMEAVEVERPQDHLTLATELYGRDVRALQLVWADVRGAYPWDPGARPGQPLLGRRGPCSCEQHRTDRLDVPPHL